MVRIVLNGSRNPLSQKLALEIFHMCVAHSITIELEWIPRAHNDVADYISKIVDHDDQMLHPNIFPIRSDMGKCIGNQKIIRICIGNRSTPMS